MSPWMGWLGVFGSLASIVGLILTYLVWKGLKNLREFYVARATIPAQLNELNDLRAKINEQLSGDFDEDKKNNVEEALVTISANVESMTPKLIEYNRDQYERMVPLRIDAMKNATTDFLRSPGKDEARRASLALLDIVKVAEYLVEDDQWRRTK